jgi:hypothetical protein
MNAFLTKLFKKGLSIERLHAFCRVAAHGGIKAAAPDTHASFQNLETCRLPVAEEGVTLQKVKTASGNFKLGDHPNYSGSTPRNQIRIATESFEQSAANIEECATKYGYETWRVRVMDAGGATFFL